MLEGQLVEGARPEDDVHLANLAEDMGERRNLKDKHPEITAEIQAVARAWRAKIQERWENEWLPKSQGTTTHPEKWALTSRG